MKRSWKLFEGREGRVGTPRAGWDAGTGQLTHVASGGGHLRARHSACLPGLYQLKMKVLLLLGMWCKLDLEPRVLPSQKDAFPEECDINVFGHKMLRRFSHTSQGHFGDVMCCLLHTKFSSILRKCLRIKESLKPCNPRHFFFILR